MLTASAGGPSPEITAEALRTVLEGLDQTSDVTGGPPPVATPPGAISGNPDNWPQLQWNDWDGVFRAGAQRIIFVVTDNPPGGSDEVFNSAGSEDTDLATDMANLAAAQGVVIQPVLAAIGAFCDGGVEDGMSIPGDVSALECTNGGVGVVVDIYQPDALTIMQNYADTTGGTLTQVPANGEGTALAIVNILENCGGLEPQEGRMTGGGSVFHENSKSNPRVTHGFTLHCDGGPNRLQVNWPGHRFHLEMLENADCFDFPERDEQNPVAGFDTMEGNGVGRLNGVPGATIEFTFVDDGEPGKVSDTASMVISDGGGIVLEVAGTISKGNQQAHSEN